MSQRKNNSPPYGGQRLSMSAISDFVKIMFDDPNLPILDESGEPIRFANDSSLDGGRRERDVVMDRDYAEVERECTGHNDHGKTYPVQSGTKF